MTIDIKSSLVRQRAEVLDRLVALAGENRPAALHLVEQLALVDKALGALSAPLSTRFASAEGHIQAILMFLDEVGRPATLAEITSGVISGGYLGGAPGTALKIRKSVDNYLTGTGSKTRNYIKRIGDLIGRHEWEDSRFARDRNG